MTLWAVQAHRAQVHYRDCYWFPVTEVDAMNDIVACCIYIQHMLLQVNVLSQHGPLNVGLIIRCTRANYAEWKKITETSLKPDLTKMWDSFLNIHDIKLPQPHTHNSLKKGSRLQSGMCKARRYKTITHEANKKTFNTKSTLSTICFANTTFSSKQMLGHLGANKPVSFTLETLLADLLWYCFVGNLLQLFLHL